MFDFLSKDHYISFMSKDGATPSGVSAEDEEAFRQKVTSEFPSLCADSLPPDGPVAGLLDDSPFRVKLRLKEGVQPQDRRPYRIPESYRPDMEKNYYESVGVQTHLSLF